MKRLRGAGMTAVAMIVLSGAAVSALGQRQYVRFTTDEVWVSARPLEAGQVIQASDLARGLVDSDRSSLSVPDVRALIGKKLAAPKVEGEMFTQDDLTVPQRNWLSDMVPEGRVVYSLEPDMSLIPYTKQLRNGDRFDILATAPGGRVSSLAYDVILLGILKDETARPQAPDPADGILASTVNNTQSASAPEPGGGLLMLAVNPEYVYPLASALGSSAKLSFVVHSNASVVSGDQLTIRPPVQERSVEVFAGLEKSYVTVEQMQR